MWSQIQKRLSEPANDAGTKQPKLDALQPGSVISFAASCPLPQLAHSRAIVTQVRTYRFGEDLQTSYALEVGGDQGYSLTVAEDEEGFYLALSRELSEAEQDHWFGRDALSFFTEPSTARTLRCKVDLATEGAWAAPRYVKSVDWVPGSVLNGRVGGAQHPSRQVRQFHYNLLVNELGDKALEIEHDDASGESRVLITVYRPVDDIASLATASLTPPANDPPALFLAPALDTAVEDSLSDEPAIEAPLFSQPTHRPRPDFRRLADAEPIHILREEIKPQPALDSIMEAGMKPLPSFLTGQEKNYLSLDEVIPPETDRVRCDLRSAKALIDLSLNRNVRVRDVLRELVGLDSALNDEVLFEMPLSDADYRQLAMRYRLRPDHRDEIRARLQQELAERLIGQR